MSKSQYPHPMQNQSQEDFMDYAEYIMKMPESDFNKNNCSELRDNSKPYSTYEAIEESLEFKKGAQIKILQCENNPDTFMNSEHLHLQLKVSIKHPNRKKGFKWENGKLTWFTILERLHKGTLKEIQRDVQWGIFEYKGILSQAIKVQMEKPIICHQKFLTQLIELVETGRKCNLSYSSLKKLAINSSNNEVDFSESVQEHCQEKGIEYVAFGYTSKNSEINSLLSDLSTVLQASSNSEIKCMLAFMIRTMGSVKESQAKSSENAQDFKERVESSSAVELMCAIIEESKIVQENLELYITKEKGEINGTIPSA